MNDPQPTPPLPDEIEAALNHLGEQAWNCGYSKATGGNAYPAANQSAKFALDAARHAISTALAQAQEDSALRERAERLRRFVRAQLGFWDDDEMTLDAAYEALEADDLDDDLVPAQEAARGE